MTRAHPVQHTVHSHKRSGVQVHQYTRGHGKRPAEKPRQRSAPAGGGYSVTANGRTVTVRASTVLGAMDAGLSRIGGEPPSVAVRAVKR